MNNDVVALYCECRLEDQRAFYHARADEFRQASRQGRAISTVLVAGVIVASSLESVGLPWLSTLATILAVVFPLLVQMLAAYCALYAFASQAELYTEAADQLDHLALGDEQEDLRETVEAVLEREQGQWPIKVQDAWEKEPR